MSGLSHLLRKVITPISLALLSTVLFGQSDDVPSLGASVEGVVSDQNGAPVRGARIRVVSVSGGGGNSLEADTEMDGSFRLRVSSAGDYNVYVTASGYAPPSRFERHPRFISFSQKGAEIVPHVRKVDFTVSPESEVSGTLLDGTSQQPIPGLGVMLMASTLMKGMNTLVPIKTEKTNNKGEFVFRGVPGGEYFLQVVSNLKETITAVPGGSLVNRKSTHLGYRRSFLPSEVMPDSSNSLKILSGSHVDIGSVVLNRQPLFTVRAKGNFGSCRGEPATVLLLERYGTTTITRANATVQCDQEVLIAPVGPGSYTLAMWIQKREGFDREIAVSSLMIDKDDIELHLDATRPMRLDGVVSVPEALKSALSGLRIQFTYEDWVPLAATQPQKIEMNGRFFVPLLFGGNVRIRILGLTAPLYVRRVEINGTGSSAPVVKIVPTEVSHFIKVSISDRPGGIRGVATVKGTRSAATSVLVTRWPILFADEYPVFDAYMTNDNGEVTIFGLAPGGYRVVAVTDSVRREMERRERARSVLSAGEKVEVTEGSVESVKLEVVGQ